MILTMSDPDQADPERAIASILDRLGAIYEEAEATIDAITDPEEAFAYATDLAARTRELHDEVEGRMRVLRGRQAARIRDDHRLSLRGLAERISTSKSNAERLVADAASKGEAR
jgi:hypothetical protein